MKITMLGSSGYPRSLTEKSSCIFLPEYSIILDAGSGLVALPQQQSYKNTEKFYLLLTHFHVDHLIGLFYVLPVIIPDGKKLVVMGDERLPELGRLFKEPFFSSMEGSRTPVQAELLRKRFTLNNAEINVARFSHDTAWTNGFRMTDGQKTLVYITDTTANSALAKFAEGADLLIHECNYPNRLAEKARAEGHSYSDVISDFATKAKVKQLIISHTEHRYRDEIIQEVRQKFVHADLANDELELNI